MCEISVPKLILKKLTQIAASLSSLTFFLLMLSVISTSWAETHTATHLMQIKNQIKNLQTHLKLADSQRDSLQQDLQKNEVGISQLAAHLQRTQNALSRQQQELQKLVRQQMSYQQKLNDQQKVLAMQIRMAYMLSQQEYLKVFFNQTDMSQTARMLTYSRYLLQNRKQAIDEINHTLAELTKNKQAIQSQAQSLLNLKTEQQQDNQELQRVKHNRERSLQKLNSDIQSQQQRLTTLIANKQALEKMLVQLEAKPPSFYYLPSRGSSFDRLRGKLRWPTLGAIVENFGTQIQESELKLNGVLIRAPEGQNVYAIAPGRVVFANWMAGYGLLLIIDHGHGYMSLYGRNSVLYKKEGNTVSAGDIIASVGKTGGYNQAELYFAIRNQGKPVDPSIWCKL